MAGSTITQRIALEGAEQIKQALAQIGKSGQEAFQQIQQAGGAFQPYLKAGVDALGSGLQNAGAAYGQASGAANPFNQYAGGLIGSSVGASSPLTGANISQYESPYTQDVINQTMRLVGQQQAQQQTNLKSDEIQQGAFGGDRSGIAKDVLSGQQNLATGNIVSGLNQANYSQALAAAQQQRAGQGEHQGYQERFRHIV